MKLIAASMFTRGDDRCFEKPFIYFLVNNVKKSPQWIMCTLKNGAYKKKET